MDLNRLFVRNLKKWRKVCGLSQKKFAEKCGMGFSYIRQIESGVSCPSFAMLAKIALALEVEPYQLFYDETSALGRPATENYLDSVRDKLLGEVAGSIDAAFEGLKDGG
ncbi:MAG: helix-turn-helix domain-containing protein [Treponema sp.]|nr:helix-turn-helix domain-containing protein [Treponema sp.]